jgi:hypothetical protein
VLFVTEESALWWCCIKHYWSSRTKKVSFLAKMINMVIKMLASYWLHLFLFMLCPKLSRFSWEHRFVWTLWSVWWGCICALCSELVLYTVTGTWTSQILLKMQQVTSCRGWWRTFLMKRYDIYIYTVLKSISSLSLSTVVGRARCSMWGCHGHFAKQWRMNW